MSTLNLTQEWDKTFPLSESVHHRKVTFDNQFGLTLAADLYWPRSFAGAQDDNSNAQDDNSNAQDDNSNAQDDNSNAQDDNSNVQDDNCHSERSEESTFRFPAIAVSGPFGAVKEQSSGLYAMRMAERGFVTLAFDPSYTGESGGQPRRTASPDINTEDFLAAVDFLSKQENVDAERIGIIGICGWGGIALNAAAADTRIKATLVSTMYDMTRNSGNGYYDAADNEQARHAMREALSAQRLQDPSAMLGGVVNPLPEDAPQFVKDYYDYYITPRGYHPRSGNSNDGWRTIGTQSYNNARFLYYINEIRSAVLVLHGENAHSRYMGEAAFHYMVDGKADGYTNVVKPNPVPENKELYIVPGASHCDLYDGGWTGPEGTGEPKYMIPFDKIATFFNTYLK